MAHMDLDQHERNFIKGCIKDRIKEYRRKDAEGVLDMHGKHMLVVAEDLYEQFGGNLDSL